ncbi:MAG: protein translocase subunit SecD [Patescibacteria group bacterium]
MKSKTRWFLWGIIFLTVVCLRLNLPRIPIHLNTSFLKIDTEIGGPVSLFGVERDLQLKKGLDIQGGIHVVLEADMSGVQEERRGEALEAAKEVVSRRVDLFGVTEANVQTARTGSDWRIIVELPGVTDTEKALDLIGETAQLDFRKPVYSEENGEQQLLGFEKTDLTGENLQQAQVTFSQQTSEPQVAIKFDAEGTEKFAQLTELLVGEPLAIFLDEQPISAPRVQEKIANGEAVISGQFTVEQAKKLSIQLNAGALPVPLQTVEQRQVEASLGQAAVRKSVVAGVWGLIFVFLFMVLYYGKLGVLSGFTLLEYGLVTITLYRLIPVTLTMPGLTGFILSVGMVVDSSILVFERIRRETRAGTPKDLAVERSFMHAIDAIKDANVCDLLICFLLFNPFNWGFLNTSGVVRGFALTLALGIVVGLFTGVVMTKVLLRLFYK